MFKVTRTSSSHLNIEFSGKINAEEMHTAIAELESASRDIENGTMLYDVVEFHLPSLAAVVIKLSSLPTLFGIIRKFCKAAILADQKWLRQISEFEGLLIPGLEIKAFSREQKAQAQAWLRG